MLDQKNEPGLMTHQIWNPPNITLKPNVNPTATPAKGAILKFLDVVTANTT